MEILIRFENDAPLVIRDSTTFDVRILTGLEFESVTIVGRIKTVQEVRWLNKYIFSRLLG